RPSPLGWLEGDSLAYRMFQTSADPVFTRINWADVNSFEARISHEGYLPDNMVANVTAPPDPIANAKIYQSLAAFTPEASVERPGMKQFLALRSDQVILVVLEMPVPPTTYAYLPGGALDYMKFSTLLEARVRESGASFWGTRALNWLPTDGWQGRFHLN